MISLGSLSPAAAARRFAGQRGAYYAYLARIIEASKGRKALRQIFLDDAERYGRRPRGVLSAHWAERFEESGDLAHTFEGTLPPTDVVIIGALQRSGGGALEAGLQDLAGTTALTNRLRVSIRTTAAVGGFALGLLLLMLAAIPLFTVPELKNAFSTVPVEYYRASSARLFGFAELLRQYWMPTAVVAAILVALFVWTFRHLTGRTRGYLDTFGSWRVYRYAVSIQLLATMATLLRQRGAINTRLREGIELLRPGAPPYLASHLDTMLERINDGVIGAETFHTGLLDDETQYFLADMIDSRGLDEGLQQTRAELETHTIEVALRQAKILRWSLLLTALLGLLALFFWHQIVAREMISVLKLLG